jgi:nicotinamidase-related amidase
MNHVLIVIDLIEDYFDASIWPTSVIPSKRSDLTQRANELAGLCRSRSVPVVWVRQEFRPDFSDAFAHARHTGTRYAIQGTPGAALLKELDVGPSDHILTKTRFSAFHGTKLEAWLAEYEVSTVILAGITTAWCVRSTAVDAYQRDYRVILAADCMAAFDEAAHRESLLMTNEGIGALVDSSAGPSLAT